MTSDKEVRQSHREPPISRRWLAALLSLPLLWWLIPYFLRVPTLNGQSLVYRPDGGFYWGLLSKLLLVQSFLILAIPIIARLGLRFPIWRRGKLQWRNIGLHLFFAACYGLLRPTFEWAVSVVTGHASFGESLYAWMELPSRFGIAPISYVGFLLASQVWFFYWRSKDRERQLTEARLSTLRSQIHPHFLFNTLHSISTLMADDVPAARRMVAGLADLLRASLAEPEGELVPLEEEIEVVRTYLGIEETRFADRLKITYDLDPEALGVAVPHLILQPLVENAVRHGISTLSSGAELMLDARRVGPSLEILVEDNGPGPKAEMSKTVVPKTVASAAAAINLASGAGRTVGGLGLRNVRERLEALYGADAGLELMPRPGGGCRCRLHLPFRRFEEKDA